MNLLKLDVDKYFQDFGSSCFKYSYNIVLKCFDDFISNGSNFDFFLNKLLCCFDVVKVDRMVNLVCLCFWRIVFQCLFFVGLNFEMLIIS